jgi:membrane-associated phospholipid phosphatase
LDLVATNHSGSELLRFCGGVAADQKIIWTRPIYSFRTHEAELLSFTAGLAALFAVDRQVTAALPKTRKEIAVSRWASRLGTVYVAGIAVVSIYAAGRMLERARVRELGLLGIRTLCNTELLGNPLKIATQRPRPSEKGGSGRWGKGGHSFPSGHSMKCWALASLLSQEFPRRRMVGVLAYGVAGIVSLARLFGFRHFASDAFGGAVAGWYIGAMVHQRHRALPGGTPV